MFQSYQGYAGMTPYGANPYQVRPDGMQPMQSMQPMQAPQLPQIPQNVQGVQLNKVNGIGGAQAFQLPPNSMVPLFDINDDILYLKYTDSGGFASMRTFRLMEVTPGQQPAGDFVTRSEFEELKGMIYNAQQHIPEATKPAGKRGKPSDPAAGE